MGMTWTEEQKKVIDVRNKNVLVSAAAGSGKTAVLVERILSIVCGDMEGEDPVDVDRLLVVTFTKAAAAEMRERVGLALERRLEADPENEHLQKQQTLIHNAQITTIDSFCQYVIRNYFHQIDLDPSFRIGDEGELKLLKGDVVRELLEDHYAEEDPEEAARFTEFVEAYATGKSDAGLETLILQLYEAAISYPYPKRWLSQCMDAYRDVSPEALEKSSWMEYLLTLAGQTFSDLKEELQEMREFCRTPGGPYMYEDAIRSDLERAETLAQTMTELFYTREPELFLERLTALDGAMNNYSLVLSLEYRGARALLPGDTNAAGYGEIPRALLTADLFKVGHHGQRDGANPELLAAIRPAAVVCCASSDRRYHSADPELLRMIAASGARLYFSDCPPVPEGIPAPPPHRALQIRLDGTTLQSLYFTREGEIVDEKI